jgi:hypothetical protein
MNLNCPQDFFIYGSALAFQAKQDGMASGISSTSDTPPITGGEVINFSMDNEDWDYNPGFRVGLGGYIGHDAWALGLEWTWLNITNYLNYDTSGTSAVVYPLWGAATGTSTANALSSCWNVHYDTLDLKLGKPYHVSRYVVLQPHFGLRAAWINQHFSVHYYGATPNPAIHHGDNDFWGVGARGGLMSSWMVGKGWELLGNFATSILFGKFENTQRLAVETGTGTDFDENYYQTSPNMELQLGIAWHKYFCKQRYRFNVTAMYEFHEWWDQLTLRKLYPASPTFNDTVSRGNLTLNGFSFSLGFDL